MFDPQPLSALKTIGVSTITPIGSDGAGSAKIMSAAEIRAAGEAYSSSQVDTLLTAYLPLAGGTLTGPITGNNGTAGIIEQRSGLTAQCYDLFETFTSGTNNGKLRFKPTSSGHQIGSARATSGSNRSLQLGHFDASEVFAAGLTVATDGTVSFASTASAASTIITTGGVFQSGPTGTILATFGSNTRLIQSSVISWSRVATNPVGANADTGVSSPSAGLVQINNGTAGTLRDLQFRDLLMTPSASRTLSTNGQFSIEMTSNTAGNLVYRGSDGTTRRFPMTFA